MEEIIKLLFNYGAIGVILAYFIYKDNKTMSKLTDTLKALNDSIIVLTEMIKGDN